MLEAKTNFLTQAENQRIQQEKLDQEKAELEQLNKDLEAKQKKLEAEKERQSEINSIVPETPQIIPEPQANEMEVVAAEIVSGNKEEAEEVKNKPTNINDKRGIIIQWLSGANEEDLDEIIAKYIS
jgi:septal ring factor EnvC (AmiA/AmiB activator)